MSIEIGKVARIAHEVNRAYCAASGDDSQVDWDEAPEWQKESAIAGVSAHVDSGFTMTPEQSHESWMAQKVAENWIYGPVKDADKKEHPCMVPYGELPLNQRVKDYLFRAVVHAALHDLKHIYY